MVVSLTEVARLLRKEALDAKREKRGKKKRKRK